MVILLVSNAWLMRKRVLRPNRGQPVRSEGPDGMTAFKNDPASKTATQLIEFLVFEESVRAHIPKMNYRFEGVERFTPSEPRDVLTAR
jgi:hypothetical protein